MIVGRCEVNGPLRILQNPCIISLYVIRQVILSIFQTSLELVVKCEGLQLTNLRH